MFNNEKEAVMSSLSSSVWERSSGYDEMDERTFVGAVSGFTAAGLTTAALVAYSCLGWQPGVAMFLLVGLGIPIAGIILSLSSSNWVVSLAGYGLVVVGMGAISGPSAAMLESAVIMNALMATAGTTVVMSIIGITYPKSLAHWGGWLFGLLLTLLFVRLGQVFMAGLGYSNALHGYPLIDYLAAILFCGYIIFDWNRAMRVPKTLDNAVDCAVALFLDILNLFWTLAKIFSGNKSSDR